MIVADASAVLEILLQRPAAETVAERLFRPRHALHAPHLLDVEVAQVLRRHVASRELDGERGRLALLDLADMPLRRHPHTMLLERVWDVRHTLSAYDAVYVALAELLDAPIVTCDRRLAEAHGHGAKVELV
jgi:predicted nucleic acid-binding protein